MPSDSRHCEALALFEAHSEVCDDVWRMFALRCCLQLGALDKGKAMVDAQIGDMEDAEVVRRCWVQLQSTLLCFYGQCGDLRATLSVFGGLRDMNQTTTNCVLQALVRNGRDREALDFYAPSSSSRMKGERFAL